jgi:hypothetical protein
MLGAVIKFCIISPKFVTKKIPERQLFSIRATDCTSVLAQGKLGFQKNGRFKVYVRERVASQRTREPTSIFGS